MENNAIKNVLKYSQHVIDAWEDYVFSGRKDFVIEAVDNLKKALKENSQQSTSPAPLNENPFIKKWPNSSNIDATEYTPPNFHLDITFKNGLKYRYYDVPPTEWESLKEAESIGKYINTRIKGHYQSQNLDKPAQPTNILNAESGL